MTLFLSLQTLIDNSVINETYNPKVLREAIKDVQESDVLPLLGANLYAKTIETIESADPVSEPFKTLLNDKIQPVLIYGVLRDLSITGNYRFNNVGAVERKAENTKESDHGELQKLSDFYKSKFARRAALLTDYLKANIESFPEYNSGNSCKDAPQSGQFETGIYLGV